MVSHALALEFSGEGWEWARVVSHLHLSPQRSCSNCGNSFCSRCCSFKVPKAVMGATGEWKGGGGQSSCSHLCCLLQGFAPDLVGRVDRTRPVRPGSGQGGDGFAALGAVLWLGSLARGGEGEHL